jgi:hypothetical protein
LCKAPWAPPAARLTFQFIGPEFPPIPSDTEVQYASTGSKGRDYCCVSSFGWQHSGKYTDGSPGAAVPRVASVRQDPNSAAPGPTSADAVARSQILGRKSAARLAPVRAEGRRSAGPWLDDHHGGRAPCRAVIVTSRVSGVRSARRRDPPRGRRPSASPCPTDRRFRRSRALPAVSAAARRTTSTARAARSRSLLDTGELNAQRHDFSRRVMGA